jgi:hypothetical protein
VDPEDRTGQDDLFTEDRRPRSTRPRDGSKDDLDAGGLRFDGPIPARVPVRDAGRTGTPFLAAALLAGAVVVLVGVTLILRSGDEERAEAVQPPSPLESLAGEDDPAMLADARLLPPADGSPAAAVTGEAGTTTEPAEPAPERAAPAVPPPAEERTPAPAASTPPPPAKPRDRAPVESAPSPAIVRPVTVSSDIGGLVRSGDLDGAFRAGKSLARQAADRGEYTVQVLSVRNLDSVREAFGRIRDERLVVVSLDSAEGKLYRLLWGFYPSREEAQKAAASCPGYFPRSAGWPFTPPVAAALKPPGR